MLRITFESSNVYAPSTRSAAVTTAVPAQLQAGGARLADIFIPRGERDRVEGPEADEIVEVVGEIRGFDPHAIARKTLLDGDVESARPLRFQIRIAEKARRRAVRLDEQRLLDSASDAGAKTSGSKRVAAGDRRAMTRPHGARRRNRSCRCSRNGFHRPATRAA